MSEKIDNILRIIDEGLAREDEFIDQQRQLVDQNAIEAEEAELAIEAFHRVFIDKSYY